MIFTFSTRESFSVSGRTTILFLILSVLIIKPIQNGEGEKRLHYLFFSCNLTNVGIVLQNFLSHWCNQAIPGASPELLNLNQEHNSKKLFFWSNPYKIEVMITSLIKMLPNFGHMTASTIWFESCDKILLMMSWAKIMMAKLFFTVALFEGGLK